MKIFRRLLLILLLCGLTGVSVLQAETCTDLTIPMANANSTYLVSASSDGTVTDTRSGLMWKQCAEGLDWNGSTCSNGTGNMGTPMSWSAALQLAVNTSFPTTLLPSPYADWRLPNIKELSSLVELCRSNSAINDSIFPNTQNLSFWSSSPSLDSPGVAWMVNFADGSVNNNYRSSSNLVRLVRGGWYDNFDLSHTQTLTFGPAPTLLVGGSGTVSATGGAPTPCASVISFSSLTPAICISTASGGVTGVIPGICIIAANKAACGVYTVAPQVTQRFPVAAVPLYTLNVNAVGVANVGITGTYPGTTPYSIPSIVGATPVTLTAPSSVGSVVFAGWSGCTGAHGPEILNCGLTLNATTYVTAIYKTIQTITFGSAPTIRVSGTGAASAIATSGLPVTFTSLTPAICTSTAPGLVTGLAVGDCTIAADQAGNSAYSPALQVTQIFPVAAGVVPVPLCTLNVNAVGAANVPITGTYSGTTSYSIANIICATPVTLTAPSSVGSALFTGWSGCSGVFGPLIFSCTLSLNAITYVTVGYKTMLEQSITFGSAPTIRVSGTGTASAIATSGLPVTFTSLTPAICTSTAPGLVTGLAVGNCTIAADQAGDSAYNPAPQATQIFPVAAGVGPVPLCTLNVNAVGAANVPITGTYSGTTSYSIANIICATPVTLTAPSSVGSALFTGWSGCSGVFGPLIFSCTLSLNTITYVTVGYKTMLDQSITFGSAPTIRVSGTGTASAIATSGLPVTFTSLTPLICTSTAPGLVTGLAVGNCTIAADQAGDSAYNPAPQATQIFPVAAGVGPVPLCTLNVNAVGAANVPITGTYSGTTSYSIANIICATPVTLTAPSSVGSALFAGWSGCLGGSGNPCTISLNAITYVTANYKTLIPQAISFIPPIGVKVGGTGFLSAMAYPSGFAATFSQGVWPPVPASPICTVSGSTVTGRAVGLCCVTADQPGNSTYSAAPSVQQCFGIALPAGTAAPNPPTISTITAGRGSAKIVLIAPTVTGGSPLGPYTATCTAPGQKTQTVSGAGLTLTVSGLKSKVLYTCTATASNTYYSSAPSAAKTVTSLGGGVSLAPILMLLLD